MDETQNRDKNAPQHGDSLNRNFHQSAQDQPMTIPVIEEKVQIDKKTVETGTIRITKVISEQEVPVNIPLVQEEHDIERVPVNEYVDSPPPPIRYDGDTMIIPIVQEVMVVEKRLMVVEELRISKKQVHTNNVEHVNLRKEEINIERIPSNNQDLNNSPQRQP